MVHFRRLACWGALTVLCLVASLDAGTEKYRLTWRDNPATTMVVGWAVTSGNNATVYYDTADGGTNPGNYAFSRGADATTSEKGMTHQFARLQGLQPDTPYYFVIADSNSTSQRFWFRTAPDDSSSFTVIAGGDSRNNASVRRRANRMVAKLRPLFVMFGGDMTDADSNSQWRQWLDDWQSTIADDGRMFPIVAARGNHERNNAVIQEIFDTPSSRNYYALTFGNNMLRTYTLNSEDTEGGDQASWLANDLAANQQVTWRIAQYHKPMRPHVGSKSEGWDEYSAWANLFYTRKVQLVVECDSHCVKSTWPVRPSNSSGSDEGFVRDDSGTVYVGEGTWGAPLRSANDAKAWTRNSASFNQFKWMRVATGGIDIKTVRYDNVDSVGSVSDNNPWAEPNGIDIWSPSNGAVITIPNANVNLPVVNLTQPSDNQVFDEGATVTIAANASLSGGSIDAVRFYVGTSLLAEDTNAPFQTSWTANQNGEFQIRAVAYGSNGETRDDSVTISVGVATLVRSIAQSSDDAEERSGGSMYRDSSDLELIRDGTRTQTVGLRFNNLFIPQGAEIDSATIQFTVDETSSESTNLVIFGQDTADAATFSSSSGDISDRARTSANVAWSPSAWSSTGAAGSAQRTPDLKDVVAEIVSHPDWQSGNSMAFLIEGEGRRVAEAYDGESDKAAELTVTFGGGDNPPGDDSLLQNGDSRTNLAGAARSETFYRFDLPANASNLRIAVSGGNGDVDLYVRRNAQPTTSSWDYRPYLNGNNETVSVNNPAEGTWHLMLQGYQAFSGVTLRVSWDADGGNGASYRSTTTAAIPDNSAGGAATTLNVTHNGDSGTVSVTVDISHTYIGDLNVRLVAPDGTRWVLHGNSGGSANDINQTYTVDAAGVSANGTWRLEAVDNARYDTGTINGWTLTF